MHNEEEQEDFLSINDDDFHVMTDSLDVDLASNVRAVIQSRFEQLGLTHQLESTAPLAVFPNSDKVT